MVGIYHSHLLFHFLVLVCLFLLPNGNARTADTDEADRILRSRVPNEVRKFAERFQSNAITIENRSESEFQGGDKSAMIDLIKKHDQSYVMKVEKTGGNAHPGLEFCYGINSKYSFELTKNKSGSAWLISKVVFVTPDFDERKAQFILLLNGGFRHLADNYISSLTSIWMVHGSPADGGVTTENLFKLPGHHLNSVSLDGTNQNVLRANFDCEVTDPDSKKACQSNCVVEFDLGIHCLPSRLHQTYKVGAREVTHDWQREWVKTGDDSYSVKVAVDTNTTSDSITKLVHRLRANSTVSTHDLPESDFTLSAFGFPEPPGVEWKKPFPWYLGLAAVGTACLGIFFFLRSRSRRTQGS